MIPQDGTGYGRSIYWEMKAKQVARKNHEFCNCWDYNKPVINLSADGKYKIFISCNPSAYECSKDFSKTNKIMTRKFREFYQDGK